MEIREDRQDGILVVTLVGRLDTNTSGEFEKQLLQNLSGGARRVVIDMLGIEYISSAGLRVFLVAAKKMRELSGRLVLCSMGQGVRQIFDLAGFLPIFEVEASRDAALGRLQGSP